MFTPKKGKLSIFIILTCWFSLFAQQQVVVNPPDYIKSIVFNNLRTNDYAPVIKLGSGFILEFDDLEADQKQYRYKVEHYDYNWELSNLNPTEYLNGFNDDLIRNFENSFNTFQDYTHYSLRFPNDNLSISISGNYAITVLDEDNEVTFTIPFIVYQPLVDVGVSVHRSREITSINTAQNIQFSINYPNLVINNPSMEVKPVVYQNNDWNTAVRNLKPLFIRGSQLLYKYNSDVFFLAGNEYLFFDTKQIRNATNNIAKSELKDRFHTYLYLDEPRKNRPYTYNPDINGNFILRTIDTDDVSIEGDYSWVYFSLLANDEIKDTSVYVYGNFNNWQLTDHNKMTYNKELNTFNCQLFLKQGFYNYTYVIKNDDGSIDTTGIDGTFFQTENEYSVLVYYRPMGTRYDQVIGYGVANSENIRN